mmetsp:Transcript_45267/g.113962  ORF Transcript_45267/g.113962 Transcript_45267/m.113962 type:complete len:96 (-) Transcript_45267:389-676(-)
MLKFCRVSESKASQKLPLPSYPYDTHMPSTHTQTHTRSTAQMYQHQQHRQRPQSGAANGKSQRRKTTDQSARQASLLPAAQMIQKAINRKDNFFG